MWYGRDGRGGDACGVRGIVFGGGRGVVISLTTRGIAYAMAPAIGISTF